MPVQFAEEGSDITRTDDKKTASDIFCLGQFVFAAVFYSASVHCICNTVTVTLLYSPPLIQACISFRAIP